MNNYYFLTIFECLVLIFTKAEDGDYNSYFLFLPSTFAYLKIFINNPVDEFLIPFLASAPFLIFIRLFLLFNKTQSANTSSRLLESSVSKMFPVGFLIFADCNIRSRLSYHLGRIGIFKYAKVIGKNKKQEIECPSSASINFTIIVRLII